MYIRLEEFDIEEIYIKLPDEEDRKEMNVRIRKRGQKDSFTYQQSISYVENNTKIEKKRQITSREYMKLKEKKLPETKVLIIKRKNFLWNSQ